MINLLGGFYLSTYFGNVNNLELRLKIIFTAGFRLITLIYKLNKLKQKTTGESERCYNTQIEGMHRLPVINVKDDNNEKKYYHIYWRRQYGT